MTRESDHSVEAALSRAAGLVELDRNGWFIGDTHRGTDAAGLTDALYERWYTRPSAPPAPVNDDPPLYHAVLVNSLRAAHYGAGLLSHGWVVTSVNPAGGVAAVRGDTGRVAACGDYVQRVRVGVPPAPGEPIDLVERLDHLDADRGLWWTYSEPTPAAAIGRVYFNARAATAPRALHEITAALSGIVFQLKCPVLPDAYRRVDAMVLYHARDTREAVLAALTDAWPALGPLLDPAVPPLTGFVRPGLAIADEFEGGRSYGESRCGLLADAMIACGDHWTGLDVDARRRVMLEGLATAGLDVEQPWQNTVSDTDLVEAALEIGRALCDAAEPAAHGCTWTAPIALGGDRDELILGHGDVGSTLYDGTAGIAVALAACAAAAPGETFSEGAHAAVRHALADAEQMLRQDRLGLFDGAAGVALSAAFVGRTLDDQPLRDEAARLAAHIATQWRAGPPAGDEFDLIGGVAGTMLALQGCAAALGVSAPNIDDLAAALTRTAKPQTWGAAWVTGGAAGGGPPLLGLGHGAAGIALALGEAAANGDSAAVAACAQALEYERGWFEPEPPAWPDLRELGDDGQPAGRMAAWCHGAIGIGLSRVRLAKLLPDPRVTAEATAALQAARNLTVQAGTALRGGSLSDCTACHGLAGVVELMLVAAHGLGVHDHAQAARRVARLMLEQRAAAERGWPCGLPGAGEVPALMTGTAGIALTLLRAAGATDIATPLLPGPSGW